MQARALIGKFFMKKKWMVHRDGSCWRHCRWNFLPAKVFSLNFLRVKLNFSCYLWQVLSNIWVRVSRRLWRFRKRVWTSETSKDQQSESAAGQNNTCTCSEKCCSENNTCRCTCMCACTCRICNLISAEKATFQREKCRSCFVIKAMDNV